MSELSVGSLSGLAANSYVVDIASGSSLDLANAKADSLPTSAISTGGILQVVSTTKTDTFSTTSTSFVDVTGLSASITPRSTSSKILVLAQVATGHSTTTNNLYITVADGDDNNLCNASSPSARTPTFHGDVTQNTQSLNGASISFLHQPSTTSTLTYKIRQLVSGGTGYVNRTGTDSDAYSTPRSVSTITLIEVAG